ncbi:MAG TPA: EamA family transporter [Candidatus Limnocylindrales bacterium]|nr:EamA family transporter [Candidatus Limnocylindrales bacterium]
MPSLAIALVLVAAVLHAGWNVLLKTSGDTLSTAARLQAFGTAALVPIGIVAWVAIGTPAVPASAIGLAVISGFLEATYFVLLASAYSRGPLSLVYPLARGSAPLIAVAVGILLLQEQLAPLALAGVGCLLFGILLVSRPWQAFRAAGAAHRGAIAFALATGASIAAYSAVDRVGVRETEPWIYGSILAVVSTVLTTAAVVGGRRLGLLARAPDPLAPAPDPAPAGAAATGRGIGTDARFGGLARDALAGVLSLAAYLLVLLAYSFAPLATVAPLRETGVVLAAAWGAIRLGEAKGGREASTRIAAACLVVVGAILLAVAH